MNVFDLINELAVLGTAFFMLALSTIWYSAMLFGSSVWTKEELNTTASHSNLKIVLTYGAYASALLCLALVLALAPKLNIDPMHAALFLLLLCSSILAPLSIWKESRAAYFIANVSFLFVFIMGGSLMLEYWPW